MQKTVLVGLICLLLLVHAAWGMLPEGPPRLLPGSLPVDVVFHLLWILAAIVLLHFTMRATWPKQP
jgi:hypothetical protein